MREDEICKNCRYYYTNREGNRAGQCRIKPPKMEQRYMKVWPVVDEWDFCGKFKKQEAKNEQG